MENEEIIKTIKNIFSGADQHDWKIIKDAMSEILLLDYSSISGIPATEISSKELIENWKNYLPGFDKTQHEVYDFQVTLNDSTANVLYKGNADHFLNGDVWTVEGSYVSELEKVNNKWLVSKHKFNLAMQKGNILLPEQAKKRLLQKN